ncbi:MAG TPA: pitrilysin family protein [Vicinamibacterales bacterium]|nr:pitrilysin family protein [Vicinamibacterales bacterium]
MSGVTAAGLAPSRSVLSNGLVVIAKENGTTPAVTINLAVRAGSVCDPADALGTALFVSRTIDRGTAQHTADEIAGQLDGRGIALAVHVTRHLLTMACTCLAEDFDAVLGLIGEMATAPTFPDREVDTRRGEIITAIRQDQDNPAVAAVERLMALLYGDDHPYGRPAKGTIASVTAIASAHLSAFHRAWFAPARTALAIVGDVAAARATDAAARVFSDWTAAPAPAPVLAAPVPATGRRRVVLPMMNKAQVDIAYGFTTIARADPAYDACWIMNNVLGQYALGGRLGESIRERQGMAYYVSSTFDPNAIAGPLLVRAGVNPANVDRALASIDREMAAMAADGVTAKELGESKQYLIGSMPRTLETNAGIAAFLQMVEYFDLGLDYDLRVPERLRAVTLDQVNGAARRMLRVDRAAVVIAGPYEDGPDAVPQA